MHETVKWSWTDLIPAYNALLLEDSVQESQSTNVLAVFVMATEMMGLFLMRCLVLV